MKKAITDYKGQLQTYCQRNSYSIPEYTTIQIGGTDHEPVWESTVHIDEVEVLSTDVRLRPTAESTVNLRGEFGKTKSYAEQSAASKALIIISLKHNTIRNDLIPDNMQKHFNNDNIRNDPITTVLIIDGENMSKMADEVPEYFSKYMDIYLYLGHHHHNAQKIYKPWIKKVICKGQRKNLVDTYIQVQVGMYLSKGIYKNYLIASRDHFAACLVDVIKDDSMWIPGNAEVVTDLSHIYGDVFKK